MWFLKHSLVELSLRKIQRLIILSTFPLYLLIPSHTNADEKPVVSCFIDLTFWSDLDGDKKRGIYHELHKIFFERMNISQYRIIVAPYARLRTMLQRGQCDFSTTLVAQTDENYMVGISYWTIRVGVIALKGTPIDEYDDIRHLKIGILKQASLGFQFDNDLQLTRIESQRFGQLIDMLANKRIDAIAGDLDVLEAIAEEKSIVLGESYTMQTMPLHFVMSKNSSHADNFAAFNQQWQLMVDEGIVKDSIVKHFAR